jgi:hypothetical protein
MELDELHISRGIPYDATATPPEFAYALEGLICPSITACAKHNVFAWKMNFIFDVECKDLLQCYQPDE